MIIKIKKLEDVVEKKVFNKNELIIDRWENGMATIKKEPDSDKIEPIYYDLTFISDRECYAQNQCHKEVFPKDKVYIIYKQSLEEAGL